jgi:hypothetical protein
LNSRVMSSYFSPKCPKWVPGHKQWINQNWNFNNCNKNLKGSLATLLLCGWYLLAFHGSSCELFF